MSTQQSPARPLGQVALIALGLNGVIGVGIFFVPASVALHVPASAGAWVYALTALSCLPIALAFARLGPRFDEDGGPYVYARAAFGPRAAFVMGWLTYVSAIFSTAAVIRGLSEAVTSAGGLPVAPNVVASLTVVGIALLVAVGLKVTAWAWTAITAAKLVPLLMLLVAWLAFGGTAAVPVPVETASPPVTPGLLLRSGLIVLFALQGFEVVPVPAQHVRNPKSIGRATVVVLIVAGLLYVGLHLACVEALPNLAQSKAPMVDAARVYGGASLARLLYLGTSVSALGIALGMVAMSPRYLSTLGRADGLGTWVGATSSRGVPLRALAITAALVFALVQFGRLEQLFAMSSIAVLTQYGSTAASLAWLALRRRFGLSSADIVVGGLAMLAAGLVMAGATWVELARGGAVVLVGVVVKLVVGMRRGRGKG